MDPHASLSPEEQERARKFLERQARIQRPRKAEETATSRPRLEVPDDEEFEGEYLASQDIQTLAGILIDEYAELRPLARRRIDYAWKRSGGKERGRARLGRCTAVSGLQQLYTDADWVIWLAADHGRMLSPLQLEATLYHELCHPLVDEDDKPKTAGHDLEMFFGEVKRYGLWRHDLEAAHEVFEQLRLDMDGAV